MNKIIISGNLGKAPELRYTPKGTPVTSFSVATNERWVVNGTKQQHTEWHDCVAWGNLGETVKKYLDKGSKVLVEGRINTRKYDDKDGNTHYRKELVVKTIEFLSAPNNSTTEEQPDQSSCPLPEDAEPIE